MMLDMFYNLLSNHPIIIIFILCVILLIYTETEDNRIAKKIYKQTRIMLPITITYQGRTLFIEEKMEKFENSFFNVCWVDTNAPTMITYFINGHPVACIGILKPKLITHYYLDRNSKYDTSDFEKIMKKAVKEDKRLSKERSKEFHEKYHKTKIYELESMEILQNEE